MTKKTVRSVCPYCGVGCGIVMDVAEGKIVKVAGDKRHPANLGRLCTKGLSSNVPVAADGRADKAYVRLPGSQERRALPREEAIQRTAAGLRAIIDREGPDAVSFYVSGQMSLEAQYLANKLCKGFIGTPNIESNSRLCMASAASGYKSSLGADGPPGSYQDFDRADLFLVVGANMADCHPILFLRMMDRVKAGARLIVVDPRRNATADKADLFLQLRPGTDLALLNGLLHLLLAAGKVDEDFIARHTEGWDAMPGFLADYPPAKVAAITGLAEADLRKAAQWIGEAPEWMSCWTMGLNQSTHGTWNTNTLCNLHLATGTICRPGSGPFSLTGQPNAMGGREMGYMGSGLPGQRSTCNAADRHFVEDVWGVPRGTLRAEASRGTVALFEQMAAGRIKACWIICTNPVASVANRKTVIAGLEAAELVVAQDAYLDTETTRYADILLPGALWAEAEGVMINSERNLTLMPKAVEPPGEAMADWEIIARVACAMGYSEAFTYASASEVFEELQRFWNPRTGYDLRGASYARLREMPLQWPCPPGRVDDRNPIRYLNTGNRQTERVEADGRQPGPTFPTETGRAFFLARPHLEPAELPDADFPLVLNTGRLQHQWHTGTKTGRVPMLNKLNPGPFVELHSDDAEALGIRERDPVEVRSRRGRVVLPAVVTPRVRPGNCFAPFHWSDVFGEELAINAVTSDAVDPISLQPESKFAAVALKRLAGPREAALLPCVADDTSASTGVLVLWASQTGNAERLARSCAARLARSGRQVRVRAMDAVKPAELASTREALLVASTFGDGGEPDNGVDFWSALSDEDMPRVETLSYSVLALGNSSYAQFCGFGRRLDARLEALGGSRLAPRVDCEPGDEELAAGWLERVLPSLSADAGAAPSPRAEPERVVPAAPAGSPAPAAHGRHAPLRAPLVRNRLLSGDGALKEVRQFGFNIAERDFSYRAGDSLGVWPVNGPALVDEMLELLGLAADTPVAVKGLGDAPLAEAFTRHWDIARPTRTLVELLARRRPEAHFAPLVAPERKGELERWLWGRQIADVLREAGGTLTPQELVQVMRPLQPRFYSIASSPAAQGREVQLTVSVVRYACEGRRREGVCSAFLADRADLGGARLFLQPSAHFHPPADPSRAAIMVGPGTGIAPFRGFLHERQATGATGSNWLFFGEQHEATDFYYRDELETWRRQGHLARLSLAFSRDQTQKLYVQHRMLEQGADLWHWLDGGAHLYVCGDASRMAKDVDAALRQLVAAHGGMSAEAAAGYVARMQQERRYVRDVY